MALLNLAGGNGDLPPDLTFPLWIVSALDLTRLPPVGSKVLYFPQGHFEQWAEHLAAPPPDGHRAPFLCTISSREVFTASHAPYAVVSLTPTPDDAAAPAVVPIPRPTTFVYNIKRLSNTDVKESGSGPNKKIVSYAGLTKSIVENVLPRLGAGQMSQHLEMVDIKGRRWTFTHANPNSGQIHHLRDGWRDFAGLKNARPQDKVYFLRGSDGRLFIELRKFGNTQEAAAERVAAPPPDLQVEINEAAHLSSAGMEFTATYYPHKRLGKFFVPPWEVEAAMGIEWAAGMEVRLRKDVVEHPTEPMYSSQAVTGTVKAVKESIWHGLEVEWADSTTSMVSAWEVDLVGDPPMKKRKVDVAGPSNPVTIFGTNLAAPP